MKIALISKLWEQTSPYSDGGTGMTVGNLAEELIKRGHKISVFGIGSSKTKANVISVRENPFTAYEESIHYWNIETAFKNHKNYDIINCWVDQTAVYFSSFIDTPVVHTIDYGDLSSECVRMLENHSGLNYVAISKAIKQFIPKLNWVDIIYNGTDINRFPFNPEPKDYLLFIGRISPTKGPDIAIQAALNLGMKLILLGKTRYEYDKQYLDENIFPFIDNKKIIHYETMTFKERVSLYQNAKVLVNPISYLEAFGLTMTEAMSCGTPVIAFDNGAASEIIEDRKTGFIVQPSKVIKKINKKRIVSKEGVKGIVEAIERINKLSEREYYRMRKNSRNRVENCFTISKMAEKYEKLFQALV